jgi:hypothetical protein
MTMFDDDAVIFRRYTADLSDPFFVYSLNLHRDNPTDAPVAVFSVSSGLPGSVVSVSSGQIPFFAWTHVAAVFDGSSIKIYVNGDTPNEAAASLTIPNAGQLRLGVGIAPQTTGRFFGFVDEVQHWSTARTPAQIVNSMGGLAPGDSTNLIGYWKFEDSTGTTVVDSSPIHNDGQYRVGAHTELFSQFDPPGTPGLSVNPPSVDAGTIVDGESAAPAMTINNSGSSTLVGFYTVQGNFLSSSAVAFIVPAGASINRTVGVVPTSVGVISGTVQFSSNGAGATVSVTGMVIESKEKFNANNISAFVTRNGRIGRTPSGNAGFEWPKGSGKQAIYQNGLWLAADVGGQIRTATADYNPEFQAGPAPGGVPADPSSNLYRVYRISEGDNAGSNPDYAEWPVGLGAPVDSLGMPLLLGKQTLFAVYNDLNPAPHHFGTLPLGAEVQQTIYGYGGSGSLSNTIFIRFKIVNRGTAAWNNAYAALWSDPDIGDPVDDFAGSDINRDLGFAYNANSVDASYGSTPPSVGLMYLMGTGPGKPLNSFSYYFAGGGVGFSDPANKDQVYNSLRGLKVDGSSFVDPTTSTPTLYALNGDPVAGTGWNDGTPLGDRRMLISSGPFSLSPGGSKEIEFAIVVGQGTGNINSISVLKNEVDNVRLFYDFGPNPPSVYRITNTSDQGPGSLREAIFYANTHPGLDSLIFEIAGAGPYVIQPASPLPTISDSVFLDGTTQPGFSSVPIIELDGSLAGSAADGLRLQTSGSTIKGLVLNRFAQYGLVLDGSGTTGNVVRGNFIGTDATGTADRGNNEGGIFIGNGASGNIIGGTTQEERNIISANGENPPPNFPSGKPGITISLTGTTGNVVIGNYIGTDVTGTVKLGNGGDGVQIKDGASGNTIGGTNLNERNVISGNDVTGIAIFGNGTNSNNVLGNYVGLDAAGTQNLGHVNGTGVYIGAGATNNRIGGTVSGSRNFISGNTGWAGVAIDGANNNTIVGNSIGTDIDGTASFGNLIGVRIYNGASGNKIGGAATGEGNLIVHSTEAGVAVLGDVPYPANNAILSNSIFSNGALGIDLGETGVTPNRVPAHPIPEPYPPTPVSVNNAANYPQLYVAMPSSSIISGSIVSWPSTLLRIEYFLNGAADPSGYGQGQTLLGFTDVTTDGLGSAVFSFNSSVPFHFGQ